MVETENDRNINGGMYRFMGEPTERVENSYDGRPRLVWAVLYTDSDLEAFKIESGMYLSGIKVIRLGWTITIFEFLMKKVLQFCCLRHKRFPS